ncbi:MAG TPA: hypothetical protein VIC08_09015 [Cellvibrionaceae bacterium]
MAKRQLPLGFLVLFWLLWPGTLIADPAILKVPKSQQTEGVSQQYFVGLLQMALTEAADGRTVPQIQETAFMEQGRATYEVLRGELIDVFWMGANTEREKSLRAIKVPLTRGLVGFRRLIIHRDRYEQFAQVETLDDLKAFTACQGLSWPDTEILRHAGLRVRELAGGNEGLFRAVVAGRCDYYPRGYFEALSEIARYQPDYPEIMLLDSLVVHYPFAIYFFVSPENEALAEWIETGLERMIDNDKLLRFMTEQPLTQMAFPLQSGADWRWFPLVNPLLTDPVIGTQKRYWVQPTDFNGPH